MANKKKKSASAKSIGNPTGVNKLSSIALWSQRDKYKNYAYPEEIGAAPIDLWYEKPFYGRIDVEGDAVFPSEAPLKQLRTSDGKTYLVMNFVADAYEDLREYFKTAAYAGKISREEGPYLTLAPKKGWRSPHQAYHNWATFIFTGFTDVWMVDSTRERKVIGWDSFVQQFLEYSAAFIHRDFPIIRSHWMLSKYCDPVSSALVIDVEKNMAHDDDMIKYQGFIKNANFSFFRQAAMQFGFMVDKNAPWRLYADIASPAMQPYLEKYAIDDAEGVFQRGYYKAYLTDMDVLRTYLLDFYNSYVTMNPMGQKLIQKRKGASHVTTIELVERKKISMSQLKERYSDHYWLRMLIYIRALEMGKSWDQGQFERVVKRAQNFYKHVDKQTAMKYINNQFKNDYIIPVSDEKDLTDAELVCILKESSFSNEPGTFYF